MQASAGFEFSSGHYLARTKSARRLLYLDFDGVLHPEHVYVSPKRGVYLCEKRAPGRKLFEWEPVLIELLEPHQDVRIVLSTSWARRPGFGRALKRLSPELQQRVIGGTFHRRVHGADPWLLQSFVDTPRGLQVWADVLRRRPEHWWALDDDTLGWPAWARENLIATDGDRGLSDSAVQERLRSSLLCTAQ